MGVPPEWRKLLLDMLAARAGAAGVCWHPTLPPAEAARGFDVVVIDGMQELAVMKHGTPPTGAGTPWHGRDVGTRMKRAVYNHLEAAQDAGRGEIEAKCLVILCLDNPYQVPRNKSFVQSARDTPAGVDVDEGDGPLDAAGYDAACACAAGLRPGFDARAHFLLNEGPLPTTSVGVWRTVALRWQLTRLVTEALLTTYVPSGKFLMIDDALVLTEAMYASLRATMLRDHRDVLGSTPPFEDATLVGHLMSGCMRRVLLRHGHTFKELDSAQLGEADLKVLYYVQRKVPCGLPLQGRRVRYLVKSQDTDVLWALLLHVRSLINPATGAVDEVDVWLDSQTPRDRAEGVEREYRFINVVELWRRTHAFLRDEFPVLRNPLEALAAIVFCNRNDYVEALPPRFRVGPDKIWRTFAGALARASNHEKFPIGAKRAAVPAQIPEELARALRDFVVAEERPDARAAVLADADGAVAHDAPIYLRRGALTAFFYYMIQTSPELKTHVERHKDSRWATRLAAYVVDPRELLDAIAHLHELATAPAGELVPATASVPPPLFEVPTLAAMEARCARVEWTLNYYANAWKTPDYTHNWFRAGGELSLHGWAIDDVTASMFTNPSSHYLFAEYVPPQHDAEGACVRRGAYRFHAPRVAHDVHTATHQ